MLTTNSYLFFAPKTFITAVNQLQDTIFDISSWMTTNLLYISTHLKLNLCSLVFLNKYMKSPALLSAQITYIQAARVLGFIFDSSLPFSKQISSLTSASNYHIRDLRRITHTIDLKTESVILSYLVHPNLYYCNSLYLTLSPIISPPVTAKLPCSRSNWDPKLNISPLYSNLSTGSI